MTSKVDKIQYAVFLPQEADDLITDVVVAYNKKVQPAQYITNEVYVNWIIRDWYVSMCMQKIQRELNEKSQKEVGRLKNVFLETFATQKTKK